MKASFIINHIEKSIIHLKWTIILNNSRNDSTVRNDAPLRVIIYETNTIFSCNLRSAWKGLTLRTLGNVQAPFYSKDKKENVMPYSKTMVWTTAE